MIATELWIQIAAWTAVAFGALAFGRHVVRALWMMISGEAERLEAARVAREERDAG